MGPGVSGLRPQIQQGIQHAETPGRLARTRAFAAASAVIRACLAGASSAGGAAIHVAGRGIARAASTRLGDFESEITLQVVPYAWAARQLCLCRLPAICNESDWLALRLS